jgi:ATP synthase protein I
VLLAAGVCVVAAVGLATLVDGLVAGRPGALGAFTGGSIAFVFFVSGSLVVSAATRFAPQAAMLMALMTYALQVALVALVFAVLSSSGAVGTTLSAGWVAGGVVAATVAWTVGQLVASTKARIPAYDTDLPSASSTTPDTTSGTPSHQREVGAP